MSILDSLVNVQISISSPVAQVASFSTMLIVAPAPADEEATPSPVALYTSLTEITDAGWETTEPAYIAASIAFSNGATELYIAIMQESEGSASVSATLTAALEYDGWYGFAIAGAGYSTIATQYTAAATFADANHKLFGYVYDASASNPISDSPYSYGFATKNLSVEGSNSLYLALAVMARCFSYDAGAETWAYKSLSSITPDTFTTAEISTIKSENGNYYINCAGRNITLDGKTTAGEWIDIIRFRDWLLNDIQRRVYSAFVGNPKIPYTDEGITIIFGKITAALTEGQNRGGIADVNYDEDGNKIPGFTVTVPTMASIPESKRATRALTGIKFTARLTGAIHLVTITGTLTQ